MFRNRNRQSGFTAFAIVMVIVGIAFFVIVAVKLIQVSKEGMGVIKEITTTGSGSGQNQGTPVSSTDKARATNKNIGETGNDGRFIAYDNGTVLDTLTNLMWAASDNGRDINWTDTKSYCENYGGGGYTDWRMPTSAELMSLDSDSGYEGYLSDCGHRIGLTKLIHLSCDNVWSSNKSSTGEACGKWFRYGYTKVICYDPSFIISWRALPVRFIK